MPQNVQLDPVMNFIIVSLLKVIFIVISVIKLNSAKV